MEQHSQSSEKIMTLNEYMSEARSMWWMIFDELIKNGFDHRRRSENTGK